MVEASGGEIGFIGAVGSSDKKHYVNYSVSNTYPILTFLVCRKPTATPLFSSL